MICKLIIFVCASYNQLHMCVFSNVVKYLSRAPSIALHLWNKSSETWFNKKANHVKSRQNGMVALANVLLSDFLSLTLSVWFSVKLIHSKRGRH